ncbi:DNA mismatch repair [Tubulinosema ratisbonensis]|uniref:DNA mismatch repair n=1 Tax=Tubulinosema ratisbonensis TaxID=291195 RepID=A0A437AMA3_9MICR|nr:DNA mismatch repair [Tubulinosema ratisbonensis]
MKIIGQFNQGFILCSFLNHRIIIDQHAADEIKNYEKLKKELNLKKQYLIQPIEIKLDELDLLIINDNLELFDKNGYVVKNNKLITLPVYKGIDFLYKDFVDFVEDVKNGLELSNKLNEIIKSKACRMSIMIGQKLSHKEMSSVVYDLSLLDKPWWCPHGRPVCRVL